jgi:hypothetical protein
MRSIRFAGTSARASARATASAAGPASPPAAGPASPPAAGPASPPAPPSALAGALAVAPLAGAPLAGAPLAVVLAAALLLGACGGAAPTPAVSNPAASLPGGSLPGASATPPPVTTPAPAASSAPASANPGSSSGYNTYIGTPPPTPHADPALEARLPDALGGVALTKSSFSGSSMPTQENDKTKPTFDLLGRLGKQPADLTFAVAADPRLNDAAQAANALPIFLIAYRVQGVSAEDLMAVLLAVAEKYATQGVEKGTASLGGQTLTTYVDKSIPQAGTNYLVPRGDVLFVIQTPQAALAEKALAALR